MKKIVKQELVPHLRCLPAKQLARFLDGSISWFVANRARNFKKIKNRYSKAGIADARIIWSPYNYLEFSQFFILKYHNLMLIVHFQVMY